MPNGNINIQAKYKNGTLLLVENEFDVLIVDSFVYFEDEKAIIAYDMYELWYDGKTSKGLITEDEIESWLDDGLISEVSSPTG
jgi:hypothetical protein